MESNDRVPRCRKRENQETESHEALASLTGSSQIYHSCRCSDVTATGKSWLTEMQDGLRLINAHPAVSTINFILCESHTCTCQQLQIAANASSSQRCVACAGSGQCWTRWAVTHAKDFSGNCLEGIDRLLSVDFARVWQDQRPCAVEQIRALSISPTGKSFSVR